MASSRYVRVGGSATALDRPIRVQFAPVSDPWRRIRGVKIPPAQPLEDAEDRIRAALAPVPADVRRDLLRALTLPQDERAAAIGHLYRKSGGGALAELLIDPEEDRTLALTVADVLNESLRNR
jgi:hypothetical protein